MLIEFEKKNLYMETEFTLDWPVMGRNGATGETMPLTVKARIYEKTMIIGWGKKWEHTLRITRTDEYGFTHPIQEIGGILSRLFNLDLDTLELTCLYDGEILKFPREFRPYRVTDKLIMQGTSQGQFFYQ